MDAGAALPKQFPWYDNIPGAVTHLTAYSTREQRYLAMQVVSFDL